MRTGITAVLALAVGTLAGCASLNDAGVATYEVEPFEIDGKTMCCRVSIHNGKQIASLDAHIEKRGNDYTIDLKQRGVEAFRGQEIAGNAATAGAKAAAKMATTVILAPAAITLGSSAIGALTK